MFTLLVCADMFGLKVNLELTFPALPTIAELTRNIEEVFTAEMHAIKPPGAPIPAEGIRVNRLQVYDDVLLNWVDLLSSTQMHEYDQVYAFQPQTLWHVDTRQDLPAPRPPTNSGGGGYSQVPAGYGSPPRAGAGSGSTGPQFLPQHAYYAAAAVGTSERPNVHPDDKARITFEEIDFARKGYLEYGDMERAFRERGLDFSANTTGELFYKADLNRDGRVTFDEWQNWGLIYPNTLECVYFRGRMSPEEEALQRQMQQHHEQIRMNEDREAQIRREIETLEVANRGLESDVARFQLAAAEAAKKKQTLDMDEKELIEEEVKLERQHDQLRMSRSRFQEVSEKFNRNAAAKGSPRRARDTAFDY